MSTVVHSADAAVIGTVQEVVTSRFGPESDHAFVSEYRTAVLDVEEALWSSAALPVKAGEPVTITLLGNGRHEGERYECSSVPDVRWNDMAGPMAEGQRVLLLLKVHELFDGMEDARGDGRVNFILGWSWDNWTIEGARAVNLTPERSAPIQPLIARLREARNAPLDPASRRGVIDPLEATEPPPPVTEPPPAEGQEPITEQPVEGEIGPPSDMPGPTG